MNANTRSIRTPLAIGIAWLSFARVLANVLQVISTLILARLLAPSDVGVVVVALTMLAIMSSVTELSLSSALIHHRNPSHDHFATAWTLAVVRGLLLAVIFAAATIPASRIYADDRLVNVMFVLSLGLIISSFRNPTTIALNKQLVFWQDFVLQVAGKIVTIAVTLTIALIYRSYWALVVGGLAGQFVTVVLSFVIVRFRPVFTFRYTRELFAFSAWLTLGQLVSTLNGNFDNLVVGAMLGSAAIGLYAVGNAFAAIATREALSPLVSVFFPAFATLRDDPERMAQAYRRAQTMVVAVGLPVGIGLATVADPLVRLVLGQDWLGIIPIIQTLAPIYALQAVTAMAAPAAMASGHTRLLFLRDLQGFAVRIPLLTIGMALYSLPGLLVAHVISGFILVPVSLAVARKAVGVKVGQHIGCNMRSFAAAGLMVVAVLALGHELGDRTDMFGLLFRIAILVPIGALTYFLTHWLFWIALRRPEGPEHEITRFLKEAIARRR